MPIMPNRMTTKKREKESGGREKQTTIGGKRRSPVKAEPLPATL